MACPECGPHLEWVSHGEHAEQEAALQAAIAQLKMGNTSQPAVGLGATAAYGAGDVLKIGIGGGASKAAQTLSDYYIKRAEQYHPVIPIGAGNEVTVVFQDGFPGCMKLTCNKPGY